MKDAPADEMQRLPARDETRALRVYESASGRPSSQCLDLLPHFLRRLCIERPAPGGAEVGC